MNPGGFQRHLLHTEASAAEEANPHNTAFGKHGPCWEDTQMDKVAGELKGLSVKKPFSLHVPLLSHLHRRCSNQIKS